MTVKAKIKQSLSSTEVYLISLGISQRPKIFVDGQERLVYLKKIVK
jgi:hypothetical protein